MPIPLLSGIGFALILTIIPGHVFFGLIQTSIQKGFKYGGMFAIGVATSVFYVLSSPILGSRNCSIIIYFRT